MSVILSKGLFQRLTSKLVSPSSSSGGNPAVLGSIGESSVASPYKFEIGKGSTLKQGQDLVIFATGSMVQESLEAIELLANDKIDITLVNISTIKPIDAALILEQARKNGAVVTAEDHNVIGGLGDAVLEVLTDNDVLVPLKKIGVRDTFAETGSMKELYKKYNLSAEYIAETVKEIHKKKK